MQLAVVPAAGFREERQTEKLNIHVSLLNVDLNLIEEAQKN